MARLQAVPAAATRHDPAYGASFTPRGNVTAVSRWDVTDINNAAKRLTTYTNYYNTGTPISTTDPAGHQSSITYADAFSDGVNRNTFAYPTTLTDAGGFSSTVQYNFDFGATTRTQSPTPAGQSQGAIQTMAYNSLGQLERQRRLQTLLVWGRLHRQLRDGIDPKREGPRQFIRTGEAKRYGKGRVNQGGGKA